MHNMRKEVIRLKKLLIVLALVLVVLTAGCTLPNWITPGPEPEPEVPVLSMEANVDAVLILGEPNQIAWSIENVGELNIFKYVITFDVLYPMETKDNVVFTATGFALGIGEKAEGILDLIPYDIPETVSVSWELFN